MAIRVLVVEDSTLISSALRILLESSGYEVDVAETAGDAVKSGISLPPDVLLLDLTLPDADGLSVLAQFETSNVRPVLKLAMTGHDDAGTHMRCMAAGCDEVLIKPVPARELLRIIGERLT